MSPLQTQINSFLDGIRNRDDWLIFADWLEEQGEGPQAELLRIQYGSATFYSEREVELLRSGTAPPHWVNRLGMEFVRVPAGTFWMGGGGGKPGERQVEIANDFFLGVYPVTQEQWQTLMGSNPSHFCRTGGGKAQVKSTSDADLRQFPVEQVSWEDAQEFLKRLNEQDKNREWMYRLPTEAEWEYSCRGGASSQHDCSFHFYLDRLTNDLSSTQANFNGEYPEGSASKGPNLRRTTKVGSYKPNRLGLFDMHGNVWEWCEDSYEQGPSRVVRGGSWGGSGSSCRAALRSWGVPSDSGSSLGLRLARVPVQ